MAQIKEEKLNKWLRSEVAAAFAIGSIVVGVIGYVMNPVNYLKTEFAVMQTQVNNIKNNDLTHIFAEQVTITAKLDDLQKQQIDQGKTLVEILTLLKQKP